MNDVPEQYRDANESDKSIGPALTKAPRKTEDHVKDEKTNEPALGLEEGRGGGKVVHKYVQTETSVGAAGTYH